MNGGIDLKGRTSEWHDEFGKGESLFGYACNLSLGAITIYSLSLLPYLYAIQ